MLTVYNRCCSFIVVGDREEGDDSEEKVGTVKKVVTVKKVGTVKKVMTVKKLGTTKKVVTGVGVNIQLNS